jgi:predicted metalloprotease
MKTCVKECPSNWVIYQDLCLKICPNNTYEENKIDQINNRTYVECKQCTPSSCPKTCSIDETKYINKTDLERFKGCEVLNGRFVIIEPDEEK